MKKNEVYNKAKNIIRDRKLKAEKESKAVFDEAKKDEEFKINELNLKNIGRQIVKSEVMEESTIDLKKLEKIFKDERKKILKKIGITEGDLNPKYFCKKCCDSGIVDGHYCSCFNELVAQILNEEIGLYVNKEHTFEKSNFDLFADKEGIKKVYSKLNQWCDNTDKSKYKNLVLIGKTGVGKTFLVDCLCNKFVELGKVVKYLTSFNFNNIMLKYHTTFNNDKESILSPVLDSDVLIIDDLGTEPILRNVTIEYLYLILNERIINNKITIITTNLMPNNILDTYHERIYSRMFNKINSLIIQMKGEDLRLKNKK